MELAFETSKLHANFSQPESKVFDRLKAEYIALLDGKTYEYYTAKKDLRRQSELTTKMKQIKDFYSSPEKRKEIIKANVPWQIENAREILGDKNFFGPDEVEEAFGIQPEEIPAIPFSPEELERAKELNQFLILRVNEAPDGEPLTMKKMDELLTSKFQKKRQGKIFHIIGWYKDEKFFTEETPPLAWALVFKITIPGSKDKTYLEQTQELAKYLTDAVFKNQPVIPLEYQTAIDEFKLYYKQNFQGKNQTEINSLLAGFSFEKYAQELSDLKINQLTRQIPAEVLYDSLVYFQNTGERLLEEEYTWTKSLSSNGDLVQFGRFNADGAYIAHPLTAVSNKSLGVSFSRGL